MTKKLPAWENPDKVALSPWKVPRGKTQLGLLVDVLEKHKKWKDAHGQEHKEAIEVPVYARFYPDESGVIQIPAYAQKGAKRLGCTEVTEV